MGILFCLLLGYFLGSLNPAAWLAEKKCHCLRQEGTGNLGASNTFLVLGKKAGLTVLAFDVLKSFFAYRLAKRLLPGLHVAGLLAGVATMVGHMFPFYLHFQGGKGLACFAGLIIAYDLSLFFFLLILCLGLMLLTNYSFVVPLTAGILFPLLAGLSGKDLSTVLVCVFAGGLLLARNYSNIRRDLTREDFKIRHNLRRIFLQSREKT